MTRDVRGWPCPTADEMRAVDADAIGRLGIPARTLMESAGRAVADAIAARYPACRSVLVACGPGNNGGDGYVVARLLRERGVTARILEAAQLDRQSPESKANRDLAAAAGIEILAGGDPTAATAGCELVVDALFGVGLSRPVLSGRAAYVLAALAECGLPIVSVDVASGASSDTGLELGIAVEPDLTVALGLPKLGQALVPGKGKVLVADIGFPESSVERAGIRQHLLTRAAARALLPPRPRAAHKGTFGHVLVVGGALGKTGAAQLAALGALRSGVGLLSIAAPRTLVPIHASRLAEAMCVPLADDGSGEFAASDSAEILSAAAARDALVLGPGLGQGDGAAAMARQVAARCAIPAVIDADGLNAFAGSLESLRSEAPRVLTPHPGEAARLLGSDTAAVQADRAASARALAAGSRAVVVLKGARTVVADPGGALSINPTGGPGLAAGGSGDVLAGVIGALLARGMPAWDAARLGVYLHGLAGDLGPPLGGLASELAARIPEAWQGLAAELPEARGALVPLD